MRTGLPGTGNGSPAAGTAASDAHSRARKHGTASMGRRYAAMAQMDSLGDMDGVGRGGDALEPLSAAQRRVWFLQRLDPASTAYHECGLWRIDGPVDVAALRAALDAVAAR